MDTGGQVVEQIVKSPLDDVLYTMFYMPSGGPLLDDVLYTIRWAIT